MKIIFILFHSLGTRLAQETPQSDNIIEQNYKDQKINIVDFVNPDSEIGSNKKSLEDVPNFAVLVNDPRAALPESFTICSDIMAVFSTKVNFLTFFNLLSSNGEQLLPAMIFDKIFYTTRVANRGFRMVFPNRWVRSCMAIDSISGRIQWVVDEKLVMTLL